MSSGRCQPFCLSLNVLITVSTELGARPSAKHSDDELH